MATTFTIVAVFVPVAFMGGLIGKFFYQFGMTVAWAVLVSLFVSFTLTPMMAAWWRGGEVHSNARRRGPVAAFNRAFDRVASRYRTVLSWILQHPKSIVLVAILSLVAAGALAPVVGGSMMPVQDNSQFMVAFSTPAGSSLDYTAGKAREIEAKMRNLSGVAATYVTVGGGVTRSDRRRSIVRISHAS